MRPATCDVRHDATAAMLGIELRHLRAFVAVAEELHFTRAGERLFLAQQALSSQIRQLETMVGTQLFTRTTRRVELTPTGEALLEYARAALGLVEDGLRHARGVATSEQQQVRIAYVPSVTRMPDVIDALHDHLPAVRIHAQEMWHDAAVDGVRRGRFDVAYVRSTPAEPGLEALDAGTEPFLVTLGAVHPLADRDVVHAEELSTSVLAIWPREVSPYYFDLVADAFAPNVRAGLVCEYENTSHGGFLRDAVARAEVAAGRAFCPRVVPAGAHAPAGFVDRVLEPTINADLFVVARVLPPGADETQPARLAETAVRATREVLDGVRP